MMVKHLLFSFLALFLCAYSQSSLVPVSTGYVNDYEVANTVTPAIPTFFFKYTLSPSDAPEGGYIALHPGAPKNSKNATVAVDTESVLCRSEWFPPGTDYIFLPCLPGTGDMGDFASFVSGFPLWAVLYEASGNVTLYYENSTAINVNDTTVSPSFCATNFGQKFITASQPWNIIGSTEISVSVVCVGYCYAVAANDTSDMPTIYGYSERGTHGANILTIKMQNTTTEEIVLRIYESADYSKTVFDPVSDFPIMPTDSFTAVPLTLYTENRIQAATNLQVVENTTVVSAVWLEQNSFVVIESATDSTVFYGVSPLLQAGYYTCLQFTIPGGFITTPPVGAQNAISINIRPALGTTFDPLTDVALPPTTWNNVASNINANNEIMSLEIIDVGKFSATGFLGGDLTFVLPMDVKVTCKVACFLVVHDSNFTPLGATSRFPHGTSSGRTDVVFQPSVQDVEANVTYYLAIHYSGDVEGGKADCTSEDFFTNGMVANPAVDLNDNTTTVDFTVSSGSVNYVYYSKQTIDLVTSSLQKVTTFVLDSAFSSEGAFVVAHGSDFCGGRDEVIAARRTEFSDILSNPVLRMLEEYNPLYSPIYISLYTSSSTTGLGRWPANKGSLIFTAGTIEVAAVIEKGITTSPISSTFNPMIVNIDQAVLGSPGFVCIHPDDGTGSADSSVVYGASAPLPFGTNSQIVVNMDRDVTDGQKLFAVLHIDATADGKPYSSQTDSAEFPLASPLAVPITIQIIDAPASSGNTSDAATIKYSLVLVFVSLLAVIVV